MRLLSYLEKLANVCNVFAINVNFLDDFSLGYSIKIPNNRIPLFIYSLPCVKPNKFGDKIAGQRKRRKTEPLIKLNIVSSDDDNCRSFQKIRFNSLKISNFIFKFFCN